MADRYRRAYGALRKQALAWGVDVHRAQSARRQEFDSVLAYRDISSAEDPFLRYISRNQGRSHAQRFQDLVVLFALGEMTNGYFVEFGAADGVVNSNTLLLERDYGWRGILAEPAQIWHEALVKNRRCSVDLRCVGVNTGSRMTMEEDLTDAQFSVVRGSQEGGARTSMHTRTYQVESVSLNDLLDQHGAPANLDYLSVDTEGSELQILQMLDFGRYHPRVITVEHNAHRSGLHGLLGSKGYRQVLSDLSAWDVWYVDSTVQTL